MQTIIVTVIIIVAMIYAAVAIYRTVTAAGDPCRGCDGCRLKEQILKTRAEKESCAHRKTASQPKKQH